MPSNDQIILDRILEERRQESAPDLPDSEFFELFAAEQILKNYDLSYEEIQSGIVGGGGDGGIDSIYLLINGELILEDSELPSSRGSMMMELHVIQSKLSTGFLESAVDKLRNSTEDLLQLSNDLKTFRSVYNKSILAVMDRFRKAYTKNAARFPKLKLMYYYVTTGDHDAVHPNVKKKISKLKSAVHQLFSAGDFSFDFIGARKLIELARSLPAQTYSINLVENPISTGKESFVCLVGLRDYFTFIADSEGKIIRSLFDANVRDYAGDVLVNQGIQETLIRPQGEDFWWLNNGVTIVASKATLSGKTLTLENAQIVNGLQTSTEICNFFQASPGNEESRNILVRVIVTHEAGSRDRIIKATNRQTTIPEASLRSTDKIHRDIEEFLKPHGYYYDRRKNYYKNEGRPVSKIISISYLAQAVMAILLRQPDYARARPSTLLKRDNDYKRVFNPHYPIDLYLQCVTILKKIEGFLRSQNVSQSAKDLNNIKFHLATCAVITITNSLQPNATKISRISVNDLDDEFLAECFDRVHSIYESLGADDQVAKGPKFLEELLAAAGNNTYSSRFLGSEEDEQEE